MDWLLLKKLFPAGPFTRDKINHCDPTNLFKKYFPLIADRPDRFSVRSFFIPEQTFEISEWPANHFYLATRTASKRPRTGDFAAGKARSGCCTRRCDGGRIR